MKKLSIEQMIETQGGSWRSILLCAGIGALYSLANPVAGIIAGITCAAFAENSETGSVDW
ncbi:MAG: hypothetical protein ABR974_12505 [Bacteroidales bacterium]